MPLGISRFWTIVCGALLVGLATGYTFANQRQHRASDRAIARADSLTQAIAESSAVYRARMAQDSLHAVRAADQLARAVALQRQASRVGALAARLSDTIRVALPDTLLPLFERLGAFHAQQVAGLTGAIKLRDSVIVVLNGRVAFRDSAISGVRSQLDAAMRQLRSALAAGKPRRCTFGGAAGYGMVSNGGQVRTGPAATIGLACRP